MLPVLPNDTTINLSEGGNTWEKEQHRIHDHISRWTAETANRGARPGKAFVWMGGNETYGRPGTSPRGLDKDAVAEVIKTVKTVAKSVVVAGPVIRLWRDRGTQWEMTRAFHADRDIGAVARSQGPEFVPYIGRAFNISRRGGDVRHGDARKCHVVGTKQVEDYFCDRLGIHLSEDGYQRALSRLGHILI